MQIFTIISYSILFVFLVAIIIHLIVTLLNRNKGNSIRSSEMAVSMGILGTFGGIVMGLIGFDVNDIQGSIPQLLSGLKFAFITSIAGMISSLLIKAFPGKINVDDSEVTPESIKNELENLNVNIKSGFEANIRSNNDVNKSIVNLNTEFKKLISGDDDSSLVTQIKLLKNDLKEKFDESNKIYKEKFDELKSKFDELSDTIAKLSSEAMVEALKQAIVEFNKQLADQLGDNFKQLNEGVKNLLEWQEQYKNTIDTLQTSINSIIEDLKVATEALDNITNSLEPIPDTVESIDKLFKDAETSLGLLVSTLESFNQMREKATDAFPIIEANLDKLTTNFSDKVSIVGDTINDSTKQLTDSVKINNEQISTVLTDSTNNLKDSYQSLTNDLNSSSQKYTDDIKNIISDTSKKMNDTLTSSYDKINSNLDNAGQKSQDLINKTIQGLDQSMQQELNRSLESLGSGLASLSKKFVDDYGPLTQRLQDLIRVAEQSRNRN